MNLLLGVCVKITFMLKRVTLILLIGLLLHAPSHNYSPGLSQGDHGLNLYAADALIHHQNIYKDFHWFYGPLMPAYYALVFKILGSSVHSALLGHILLKILSGALIFLILSRFSPLLIALSGAIFYWSCGFDFFYTFNHAGGIFLLILILHFLFNYLHTQKQSHLFFSLLCVVVLGLVKINLALSALSGLILSVWFIDQTHAIPANALKKRFYLLALISSLLIIVLNIPFVLGMPFYELRQCFQYFGNDALVTSNQSLLSYTYLLGRWIVNGMLIHKTYFFLGALVLTLNLWRPQRKIFLSSCFILFVFTVLHLHEFLLSGIAFRLFWVKPFIVLFLFLNIGHALTDSRKSLQILTAAALIAICALLLTPQWLDAQAHKKPSHYLPQEKAGVYVRNSENWVNTVKETVNYLNEHLDNDERFLALPYEPLYYFLTDKTSPTRQLVFFDFLQIPPEQEQTIIKELQSVDLKYILISNRQVALSEAGLGVFGETYTPLLAKFILDNYVPVIKIGAWNDPPGWLEPHGVIILKKR